MATIYDWLIANRDEYQTPDQLLIACTKNLSVTRDAARKAWRKIEQKPPGPASVVFEKQAKPTSVSVISSKSFLASIDLPAIVREVLDNEVGDEYIRESDLRNRVKCTQSQWDTLVRLPEFAARRFTYIDYLHNSSRVTVWSSVKGIELARATISMERHAR